MAMDPPKFKVAKELTREDIFLSLASVPGSERVFLGSSDGNVYALDCSAEKLEPVAMAGHTSYVTGLAIAGEQLVSGSYDGQLIWWNTATREQVRKIKGHDKWIRDVKVSPDGKLIASVGDDMVCRLWDAESAKLKHELRGHEPMTPTQFTSMLYTCAFSADGKLLATADRVGHIEIWDVAAAKSVASVEAPELYTWDGKQRIRSIGGVRSLAFSPDAKLLAAGGIDRVGNVDGLSAKARVDLFEWQDKKHVAALKCDKNGIIEFLAFHPKGDWLLATGGEGKGVLAFIDPAEKKIIIEHEAPMHVHKIVLDEDCQRLFAAGHKKFALFVANKEPAAPKPDKASAEKAK
jgi:WD40 repeat protein